MLQLQGELCALTGAPFPGAEDAPPRRRADLPRRRPSGSRLDRVRRDFVANASHELRTPLTSIRGFVEALEDGAMDEPDTAAPLPGQDPQHADRMASLVERPARAVAPRVGRPRAPVGRTCSPSDVAEDGGRVRGAGPGRKGATTLRHELLRRASPSWHRSPTACAESSRTSSRTR